MMLRVHAALLVALLSTVASADTVTVSSERPLTPPTNTLSTDAAGGLIASNGTGYVVVATRFDKTDVVTALDDLAKPLATNEPETGISSPTALIAHADRYVLIGPPKDPVAQGIYATTIAPGGVLIDPAQPIISDYVNGSWITSNGTVLLLAWMTTSLSRETVHGVILDSNLRAIHGPFPIATRDLLGDPGHPIVPSFASNGTDFLMVWEEVSPNTHLTFVPVSHTGLVGAPASTTFPSPVLQPLVIASPSGFIAVWHDGIHIRGMRVNPNGSAAGTAAEIVTSGVPVLDLTAVASPWGTTVGFVVGSRGDCNNNTRALLLQKTDSALAPTGKPLQADTTLLPSAKVTIASTGQTTVAAWTHLACSTATSVMALTVATGEVPVVLSGHIAPATQSSPAAASDGSSAVVIWLEQRTTETSPQVYAAAAAGTPLGVRISDGVSACSAPRIAYGGGRFLAVWWEADTLTTRLVGMDGQPIGDQIILTQSAGPADVAWDGSAWTVIWSWNSKILAAHITQASQVTMAGSTPAFPVTGAVFAAGGPGEVVALFVTETNTDRQVTTAVVPRDGNLSVGGLLVSAPKACFGAPSACRTAVLPVAIAWNGTQYLALTVLKGLPGYGYNVSATPIAAGGTPVAGMGTTVRSAGIGNVEQNATAGPLVWTGTDFAVAIPVATDTTSVWLMRLSPGGTAADSHGTFIGTTSGAPAAALLGGRRLLLVYGTSRLVTRTADLPAAATGPSRRRAVRR